MARNYGQIMKFFAYIFLMLTVFSGSLFAQSDPYGDIDSVYLDQMTVGVGREFVIDVNLFNDEELGGITIPLSYPTDKLEFKELSFAGGRVDYVGFKPVQIDTVDGTVLAGAIVFSESYIPPGRGKLFSLTFRLKEDVVPGDIITIDSVTIPPSYLLLTYTLGNNIFPHFTPGKITAGSVNMAPFFTPIPELYVAEGDSLILNIEAADAEGDSIILANPVHPYSSEFIDNGDGTARFAWKPDFVGPLSSDLSPHSFVFWASDGSASEYLRVKVNVINVNRPPQITAPDYVTAESGDSLGFNVSALDPDFEVTEWSISGLPPGASFDFNNPGMINWSSEYADSGLYKISLIATDPYGLADTAEIDVEMVPVTFFRLQLDTLTTFSGKVVNVNLFLKNEFAVKEFTLLINIDPAITTPLTVTNEGGRAEHYDYFNYQLDYNGVAGDILITGRAESADPIGEGDGSLCRITLQVSSDLSFVGHQVPLNFVWHLADDNRLILDDDQTIFGEDINFFNGYLLIGIPGNLTLGDINLNGVPYEISDAVYFSNFFINPSQYPMNDKQLLNSDVNRDGFAPSVADLVVLIKVITGEIQPKITFKPLVELSPVEVELVRGDDGLFVQTDAPIEMGAAYFRLTGSDIELIYPANLTGLELKSDKKGDYLNCLLLSYQNETISSGQTRLIKLSDDSQLDIRLDEIDLADLNGGVLSINKTENAALPETFALHQNYPNPFNPTTHIEFDLNSAEWVTLTVYNILGQQIKRLIDEEYSAGQHNVVWNGEDESGRRVASGIYLYRLKAGSDSSSRKMVLMK